MSCLLIMPVLLFLQPLCLVVLLFVQFSILVCVSCPLFLLHSGVTTCIESMFKLIIFNYIAVCGIPSNTGPFPGTTKNMHLFFTFFSLM